MRSVYLVYDENHGLQMVCGNKTLATIKVREIAKRDYDLSVDTTPLDYDGSLMRYGWDGAAWWQREVVYD